MGTLGLDEDWSRPDPVRAYADGYRFVIGYVSQDTTGKNLTAANVAAAHAAGLDVGLVYEYATQSAGKGAAQGRADAQIAISHARQIGAPASMVLYFAVDWNVTTGQLPAVKAYLDAARAEVQGADFRDAGAYAGYPVCHYLALHGWPGLLWQTYAWSNGAWEPTAALRQIKNGVTEAGAAIDVDEAEAPDWGQWKAGTMTTLGQDPDGQWLIARVETMAHLFDQVHSGPEKGQALEFVTTLKQVAKDAATAAAGANAPALSAAQMTELVAELKAALPTADQVAAALVAQVAAQLGGHAAGA